MDETIQNVAEMVTQMDVVREDLQSGTTSEELNLRLNLLLHSIEYVDVLVICFAFCVAGKNLVGLTDGNQNSLTDIIQIGSGTLLPFTLRGGKLEFDEENRYGIYNDITTGVFSIIYD